MEETTTQYRPNVTKKIIPLSSVEIEARRLKLDDHLTKGDSCPYPYDICRFKNIYSIDIAIPGIDIFFLKIFSNQTNLFIEYHDTINYPSDRPKDIPSYGIPYYLDQHTDTKNTKPLNFCFKNINRYKFQIYFRWDSSLRLEDAQYANGILSIQAKILEHNLSYTEETVTFENL